MSGEENGVERSVKNFFQGAHSLLECAFAHSNFWAEGEDSAESEPNVHRRLQLFVFDFGEKTLGDLKVITKALLADFLGFSFSIHQVTNTSCYCVFSF